MQCSNASSPVIRLSEVNRRVHAQCKVCSDILLCARSRTSAWEQFSFFNFNASSGNLATCGYKP